jgi:hypothetical protein
MRRIAIVLMSFLILFSGCAEDKPGVITDTSSDTQVTVDTTVAADTTADSQNDSNTETDGETVGPECAEGEGCFGDPCDDNDHCNSSFCVEHLGESVCTDTCEGDSACPDGWSCDSISLGAGDVTYICISNHAQLCRPCQTSTDCTGAFGGEDACVMFGPQEGSFCASVCQATPDCPKGYLCEEAETVDGVPVTRCIPESGVCTCSQASAAKGLKTDCSVTNDWGSCTGIRYCGEEGLSACDAATPAEETCDGVDEDCDGEIDEGTCDDGDECTTDSCAGAEGCQHVVTDGLPCEDGEICTFNDECLDGSCTGVPLTCDDDNPCTDDSCSEDGCSFAANEGACDDGNPCTLGDACSEGECGHVSTLECDDGNPCTEDICGGDGACQTSPADGFCSDDDPCTKDDTCGGGTCVGVAAACDDGNPCTDDACNAEGACAFSPNDGPCDDDNPCTVDTVCTGLTCKGTPVVCDDGNLCTSDSCDPTTGCVQVANTVPCDDGDACSVNDQCLNGACAGPGNLSCEDGNVCTDNTCDSVKGCVFVPNGVDCDDQNSCTTNDQCASSACVGSGSLECDDENPCTLDECLPEGGCAHKNNKAPCNDGSLCTIGDTCGGGKCKGGADLQCTDGNPCTDDTCDANEGCAFLPNKAKCNDGNSCTVVDACVEGACKGSVELDCNDDNPCTDEGCVVEQGCVSSPNAVPCDDGDACTLTDKCEKGVCKGAGTLKCDDGNPCTDDSCIENMGCMATLNTAPCDDGDICTEKDVCASGLCKGSFAEGAPCDDGTQCTAWDSCTKGGCTGIPVSKGKADKTRKMTSGINGFDGLLNDYDYFGAAVAHIGDLDGDGVNDVAVGAPGDDKDPESWKNSGAVWILFLKDDGSVKKTQKVSSTAGGLKAELDPSDDFGHGVAGLGDFDGDGTPDIAVGARRDDDGTGNAGAIYILLMSPNGTVKETHKISSEAGGFEGELKNSDYFGTSVAALGDVDGNGITDIAVGAYGSGDGTGNSEIGAVWILFMEKDATVLNQVKIDHLTLGLEGKLDNAGQFGYGVAGPGDIDSDGTPDLVVGAPKDSGIGAVWVFRLTSKGGIKDYSRIGHGLGGFPKILSSNDRFGVSVGAVGDLNGDGVSELAVGAHFDDDGCNSCGAVYVLRMNADGTVSYHQKLSQEQGNFGGPLSGGAPNFGRSVSGVGDINKDGILDLVVGAYHDDGGEFDNCKDCGAVFLMTLAPSCQP